MPANAVSGIRMPLSTMWRNWLPIDGSSAVDQLAARVLTRLPVASISVTSKFCVTRFGV